MGWLNFPSFTIDEAQSRGDSVYEVLYSDWGWGAVPADQWPPNGSPSVPVSLSGIAIGPRSTVDRAWVSYNLQKPAPNIIDLSNLTDRLRQVSVDAPLLIPEAAAPGTAATGPVAAMVKTGSLYVWPSSAVNPFSVIYQPIVNSTQGKSYLDINLVNRNLNSGAPIIVGPLLHLYLYLKAPLISPSTRRAPLTVGAGAGIFTADGVEAPVAVIATFGRRHSHLMVSYTTPGPTTCDFRVGGLRVMSASGLTPLEEPIDSVAGVGPNTPVVLSPCAGNNILADYTLLYVTPHGGANPIVAVRFAAYD